MYNVVSCWVIFFLLSYFFLVELFFLVDFFMKQPYVSCFKFVIWSSFYDTACTAQYLCGSEAKNWINISMQKSHKYIHIIHLTAVAWVSGPNLAPQKIFWKFFFILLSFWDTAVCLHFWVNFKMAARGPERVTIWTIT